MSHGPVSASVSRRRFLASSTLAFGGVLGSSALLSGCNAGTSSSTSTAGGGSASGGGGTTTLTVMYKAEEFTKAHIAEFEKLNPGIKITFIENDATRLKAMLAAGSPPDFVRGAGVGSSNFNAKGLALNLDPYLDKSSVLKKSDLLGVNDSWRWDGKKTGAGPYYGITKDWSQDATLWYSTALLDAAKIPHLSPTEPISYDDLLAMAKKLTQVKGGKTAVYGLGLEWAWNLWAPIDTMVQQQGGTIYNADLTQVDFTSAPAKKALQWYVDFAQAGVGPTSLNPLPDSADLATFQAGRMAITQDGFWYGGNFAKDAKLQGTIAMAPAPVMGAKRISPSYAGQGAWIPAKAKNKDAAWKLMEYFMTGTPAVERATSGWGLPALQSLMAKVPQDLPYQKQAYATTQNELKYTGNLEDSPYISWDNLNGTIDKYVQAATKKQITVDQAGQKITDDVNKLLKQGKDQVG